MLVQMDLPLALDSIKNQINPHAQAEAPHSPDTSEFNGSESSITESVEPFREDTPLRVSLFTYFELAAKKFDTDSQNRARLEIIQQPIQARSCGFSIDDSKLRQINPVPIVKLMGVENQDSHGYVCLSTLWSSDMKENLSVSTKAGAPYLYSENSNDDELSHAHRSKRARREYSGDSSQTPSTLTNSSPPPNGLSTVDPEPLPSGNYTVEITQGYVRSFVLMGDKVVCSRVLKDTRGKVGSYFVFSNLAMRVDRKFRLKFELFHLERDGLPDDASPSTPTRDPAAAGASPSLRVHKQETNQPHTNVIGIDESAAQSFVCFASLWSSDMKSNLTISGKCAAPFAYTPITASTPPSSPQTPNMSGSSSAPTYSVETTSGYEKSFNMIGTPISQCHQLENVQGETGLYFVFPDLAIRTTNHFRIRFEVYDTASREPGRPMAPVAVVMSDSFEVFRPDVFPGVGELTDLSACFIRQGVPIKSKLGSP
ncbi:hypothetical protein HDU98_007084 [Podochytrium sp. JEL0797]|nr:hypothetical protein HDU98_007084 [Podochytrium sp. JEL0797]